MASIIFVVLLFTGSVLVRIKGEDDWTISINHYALYEMVKDRTYSTSRDQAKSVLEAICEQNGIMTEHVDTERVSDAIRTQLTKVL